MIEVGDTVAVFWYRHSLATVVEVVEKYKYPSYKICWMDDDVEITCNENDLVLVKKHTPLTIEDILGE